MPVYLVEVDVPGGVDVGAGLVRRHQVQQVEVGGEDERLLRPS